MATDVLEWYANIDAKYLDLVGDYAGKEKFFIEGDSLLLECFSDPLLDFDPGFQLLHAVYLVEKYLQNLAKRGCNFDVVFFSNHKETCVPPTAESSSRYLLARTVIVQHLQRTSPSKNTAVCCFESVKDVKFRAYLEESACYFALCSDGASYQYKSKTTHQQSHAVLNGADTTVSKERKVQFRSVIYGLSHDSGLSVALLNGLTLQDSKVFAFVLERHDQQGDVDIELPISTPFCSQASTSSSDRDFTNIQAAAREILAKASLPQSSRMVTTLAALHRASPDYCGYVGPVILHTVFLESIKLANRCVPPIELESRDESKFQAFVNHFCCQANVFVSLSPSGVAADSTVVDLIDGRLLRHVTSSYEKSKSLLTSKQSHAVNQLAKVLCQLTPFVEELTVANHEAFDDGEILGVGAVLPFSHPAFDKHLQCIQVTVKDGGQKQVGKMVFDLTHWHNSKKLQSGRQTAPSNKPTWVVDREKARALRSYQKFLARQTAYAASLTGTLDINPRLIITEKPNRKDLKPKTATMKPPQQSRANTKLPKKGAHLPSRPVLTDVAQLEKSQSAANIITVADKSSLLEQLKTQGPYFERSMGAQEDARVPFQPDGWQVKVLDQLDEGNSLLVVAPTSAGKTFISFYAMEKVLGAGDDGVLVYVAPTKALVNQIAAEVQAKFRKNYSHAGKQLWSIFTRDYRIHEPTKAQILVTVPHMLQIMLMSASNKDWVPKIKSIIFDEVHSVANAEDGLVWEQLLMSAPSQIIALSATIGNTMDFAKWMSSSQALMGRKFSLIQHEHRYSDLRKYMFQAEAPVDIALGLPGQSTKPVLGLEGIKTMNLIHPGACLQHRQRGIPSDLEFESADCLKLWQVMTKHQTSTFSVSADLSPAMFFTMKPIVKADILRWGGHLKTKLAEWMQAANSPFQKVLEELKLNLPHEEPGVANEAKDIIAAPNGLLETTMPLLYALRANDALPAILFNYNRAICEDIALYILKCLSEAEHDFKHTNPSYKKKLERYELWQKTAKTREKHIKSVTKKKGNNAATSEELDPAFQARANTQDNDEALDRFDPAAPLDRFSFANIKKQDGEQMMDLFKQLRWNHVSEDLLECFQRGIAVHHSGMNRWYRQAVEMYFRKGFLTVVVATGTLSLGINMPCKTVVFSGDSVFLTALNYRQASGRAGRRGFDLLGNVVFQDIATDKVLRLMSSKLPDINGHFPMTTGFVLRLLTLLHGTNNAAYAMKMVDALLSQPRLFLAGDEFRQQVLHHIRFSIEYLRSQGLINDRGHPIGLASCVSHLYFVENNALAFHALLKEGYFHPLADGYTRKKEETLRKLMLVLAHLFGRRVMRPMEGEADAETIRKSVSRVFLPDLPLEAAKILVKHNQQTLDTYRTYVATFVDQHCKDEDVKLPFTGTVISPSGSTFVPSTDTPAPRMRSPFVALSGHGDKFNSISELCDSVRDGVFLEKAVIPYLDMADEMPTPLNAYLYDFYISGSTKALVEANKIPRGDVWYLLKDFSLVLATIITSVENFLDPNSSGDHELAQEDTSDDEDSASSGTKGAEVNGDQIKSSLVGQREGDAARIAKEEEQSSETRAIKKATPLAKKKKAKIVDSWEDESEDSSDGAVDGNGVDSDESLEEAEQAANNLRKVCNMFKDLQREFEETFKKTWA